MSLKKKISWRIEYVLYTAFERCLGILPVSLVARFARLVGIASYHLSKRYRRIVQKNLRIAFAGEKTAEEIKTLSKEVFRRSAANLLCSTRTARMTPGQLNKAVEIEGYEIVQNEIKKGKGVVFVFSHMGNWEALAQKFPHLTEPDHHSGTVYRPLNNPLLNRRVEETRQNQGLHIFSRKSTPLAMAKFVQEGNALGILCDQRAGNAGEILPFFNHLVSCTPLPSILSKYGASVVGLSIRTIGLGRWRIKIHPLEGPSTTANCMKLLETVMRESPEDVFWLQDRWRMEKDHPLQLNGRHPEKISVPEGVTLRRCLIWLDQIPDEEPVPPVGVPNDLSLEYSVPEGSLPDWLKAKKIHRHKAPSSSRAFLKEILNIDGMDALPLEIVYTPSEPSNALKKACGKEKIPLVNA